MTTKNPILPLDEWAHAVTIDKLRREANAAEEAANEHAAACSKYVRAFDQIHAQVEAQLEKMLRDQAADLNARADGIGR